MLLLSFHCRLPCVIRQGIFQDPAKTDIGSRFSVPLKLAEPTIIPRTRLVLPRLHSKSQHDSPTTSQAAHKGPSFSVLHGVSRGFPSAQGCAKRANTKSFLQGPEDLSWPGLGADLDHDDGLGVCWPVVCRSRLFSWWTKIIHPPSKKLQQSGWI